MAFEKRFFCNQCGARLPRSESSCPRCGFDFMAVEPFGNEKQLGAGGIGWSDRVSDHRFTIYQKNRRNYILLFTVLLITVISIFLFSSGDLSFNQEGLFVILFLVLLFSSIAVYAFRNTKKFGSDWTGTIVEKKGDPNKKYQNQIMQLTIRLESGELIQHPISCATVFESLQVGDQVRNHQNPNLRFLEKFDKSSDLFLYCPSCATENDARANYCHACGSPLLIGKPLPYN